MTDISRLPREECVHILEGYGFQCYDSESTAELREAIEANIKDGTIDPYDIGDTTSR